MSLGAAAKRCTDVSHSDVSHSDAKTDTRRTKKRQKHGPEGGVDERLVVGQAALEAAEPLAHLVVDLAQLCGQTGMWWIV